MKRFDLDGKSIDLHADWEAMGVVSVDIIDGKLHLFAKGGQALATLVLPQMNPGDCYQVGPLTCPS